MATVLQQDTAALLRNTLKANVFASTLSGAVMIVGAGALAPFMGIDHPAYLVVLGIGILMFAFAVFRIASEKPLDARKGQIIFVLDVVWVVGSILLLLADPLTFTNEGKWVVLILADIVGMLALGEFLGVRRLS
ncbi:MAG: hypothetical protein U0694_11450 [Anaerolineae bacterium]